jgi:hypothetical protein
METEEVVKALLKNLGMLHAVYMELVAMGKRFVCERCDYDGHKPMSWQGIVSRCSEPLQQPCSEKRVKH